MINLKAVIEIGSTGIRMLVAEIRDSNQWVIIDQAELPVSLGWDVFTEGIISRETLIQSLKILARFKEKIEGWQISRSDVEIFATSALREAKNKDTIIDRIMIKTGLKIKVIDGIQENYLAYIAILQVAKQKMEILKDLNSMIISVGGGSTEIMLLSNGKMAAVHSFNVGTVITEQHVKSMMGTQKDGRRFLEEGIKGLSLNLNTDLDLSIVQKTIVMGAEVQYVANEVGSKITDKIWKIDRDSFDSFIEKLQNSTVDECMTRFKMAYNEAKTIQFGLLSYKLFIGLTNTREILVINTSIREGLLVNSLSSNTNDLQNEFALQVIASAKSLGRKFHIDEAHADFVRHTATKLFDSLQEELGLDKTARLILEVAAHLHDIGIFIQGKNHHAHSKYIIENSEIFGLTRDDMNIIAQICFGHHKSTDLTADKLFSSLSRADRTKVLKLSSILRIADALDRGHSQSIRDFDIELRNDTLLIHTRETQDTSLERFALSQKDNLFESVFGYKVVLD